MITIIFYCLNISKFYCAGICEHVIRNGMEHMSLLTVFQSDFYRFLELAADAEKLK